MPASTVFFAVLFYFAAAVCAVGLVCASPTTRAPAPRRSHLRRRPARRGHAWCARSCSSSLFKGNLWTWALGWIFRQPGAGPGRHLRYFTEPVWGWVAFIQPFGMYAGFAMVMGWPACGRAASWSSGCATSRRRRTT